MKTLHPTIILSFGDPDENADIKTDGVPVSLIIESLSNLIRGMSETLVSEAKKEVGTYASEDQIAEYLDARLEVDRKTLKDALGK